MVRWLLALAGVLKSNTLKWLSELTLLTTLALCGLKAAEYVQLCVGSVVILCAALGFQILIVPSQLLDKKVSFEMRFQCTAKTSRACSCHDWTGNWERVISKSFTEPSPPAVRIWFSCASDQVLSKRESCVSNLCALSVLRACDSAYNRVALAEVCTHHFSATMPFAVKPSMYNLPLPTRPKFADVATAMRESKKGEYLTL